MSGKAYMNRKSKENRPKGDLYDTPKSLVWELLKREKFENILEPAAGNLAIVEALKSSPDFTSKVTHSDINDGVSFFDYKEWDGDILTNPPFSLWDEFIFHAKKIIKPGSKIIAPKKKTVSLFNRICMLGRPDCFAAHSRTTSGIWDGLKYEYVFDRRVDYRTPKRDDGHFHVGAMTSCWLIWEPGYTGEVIKRIIDVNNYATLGQYIECDGCGGYVQTKYKENNKIFCSRECYNKHALSQRFQEAFNNAK